MATAPATASPRSKKGILETCGDMMFHARWPLAKPVQNNKLPELYPAHSVCRRKKAAHGVCRIHWNSALYCLATAKPVPLVVPPPLGDTGTHGRPRSDAIRSFHIIGYLPVPFEPSNVAGTRRVPISIPVAYCLALESPIPSMFAL